MFKLILKDINVSKNGMLGVLCFWAFFIYFNAGSSKTEARVTQYFMTSMMLVFQSLFIDDKNKTENLFVSLPIKRYAIVSARYIFSFMMIGTVLLGTYLTTQSLSLISPDVYQGTLSFKSLVESQLVVIYITVLALPAFFRYGASLEEIMRVITWTFVLCFLLIFAAFLIALHFNLIDTKNMFLYCCLAAILMTAGSWLWSQRIYRKREF